MTKKSKQPTTMADDIIGAVLQGTKKWTRTVKAEERSPASRSYRFARMTRRERGVQFKEAAAEIMEQAYLKASGNEDGNGPNWANARQVMYAARGHIQKATGKPLGDSYFTQTLLPDFMSENPELTVGWNINYDARGHFKEPHSGKIFGVGTQEVRSYLAGLHDVKLVDPDFAAAKVKTCGPNGGFGAVLFVEKEGFDEQIRGARIDDRFDVALMSTKGMSVTAARALVDEMCYDYDVPLLLLRDFDKSGFSISGTLQRDTRRYEFQNSIEVIELGLSLADVEAMGLENEYQFHKKGDKDALIDNLRKNGATEDDIAFMFADFDATRSTRRVELNAMTTPQFIAFLERKLQQHGVKKVIPDSDLLGEAYRAFAKSNRAEKIVAKALKENGKVKVDGPPDDLADKVATYLKKNPTARWDAAIAAILKEGAKA